MFDIIIGIVIAIGFIFYINHLKTKNNILKWWHWIVIILWFFYSAFVIKMIESFIAEGAPKAALIMGLIFGFISILWAVLFNRIVIPKQKNIDNE